MAEVFRPPTLSRSTYWRMEEKRVLPETQVTEYSGDMGDTLPQRRRGHALEGKSRHGRTRSLCGPPARRREDGGRVRGVRDFAKNGLQDLSTLQRDRRQGADGPQPSTASTR